MQAHSQLMILGISALAIAFMAALMFVLAWMEATLPDAVPKARTGGSVHELQYEPQVEVGRQQLAA